MGTNAQPSSPSDLPAQFDFASSEREIYERWERAGAFSANAAHSARIRVGKTTYRFCFEFLRLAEQRGGLSPVGRCVHRM